MSKTAKNAKKSAWKPDVPYNQLPLLPPQVELESHPVLKECIAARAALAELKQAAEMIPNQAMLINTLPLLESQASSEIENIVTTTDKLFQHQHENEHADAATKEALRYSQSIYEGFRAIAEKPLNTRTAEQICTKIKGVEMTIRKVPGTALGTESGEVVYTPPEGETQLRSLLANWEKFLHNETDLDPLIRMAIGHYQFEAIHPFTDGNGRTGRVLNSLFLIHEGLLTLPILYLSRYIIQNKSDYYSLLLDVTQNNNWEAWTIYMLRGVKETSSWTKSKIDAILKLFEHTSEFARTHAGKAYTHELISLIFELPYCRIQNVVDAEKSVRQTAAKKLKKLAEIGILTEVMSGREKLFIHPKLMQLLNRNSNDFELYSIG